MIYLVTTRTDLFGLEGVTNITVEGSLSILKSWSNIVQVDSETSGKDPHLCKLLCFQFGNQEGTEQIVIDCETIDITQYKEILEEKFLVGHNLKFDLQFLYNYHIIPRKIYDTMIVEQLLYLGWPHGIIKYSLHNVALRRLNIDIDKSVRGEIIWRGLDYSVVIYAANDVKHLCKIMELQKQDCRMKECLVGAKLECYFIPAIAYLEWCGIHLDKNRWMAKMQKDLAKLEQAKKDLDNFIIQNPQLKEFTWVNLQGDLFNGFDSSPKCILNWSSSQQVVKLVKQLGFNVNTKDKVTGEDKESVMEKQLKAQKGINDEFLKLYFDYQGCFKVVTSFGQGHLDAVNPVTDRIHTNYKQLGAASGRMSCGSQEPNMALAKAKGIPAKNCTYPNIQQLPHDVETRACFTATEGNLMVSCDFSALESRLGADIYNEPSMIKEFLEGSGDIHSLCAYMVYKDEIPRDTPIKDIKTLYPELRSAVKPIEFSQQFDKLFN